MNDHTRGADPESALGDPADIATELFAGEWHAKLRINHQTFLLRPLRTGAKSSKADAEWQADMLRSAFGMARKTLPEPPLSIHLPDPTKP